MAHASGASGIEVEQFGRGVAHMLGGLGAGLVPLAAAQAVQGRLVWVGAAVAADQMQLRDWNKEAAATGVGEVQAFGLAFTEVQVLKPLVAANAVLQVNHGVAGLELGEVADDGVDIGLFVLLAMSLSPFHVGEELGLGEHGETEPRGHKAHLDGAHTGEHRRVLWLACAERGPVGCCLRGH